MVKYASVNRFPRHNLYSVLDFGLAFGWPIPDRTYAVGQFLAGTAREKLSEIQRIHRKCVSPAQNLRDFRRLNLRRLNL